MPTKTNKKKTNNNKNNPPKKTTSKVKKGSSKQNKEKKFSKLWLILIIISISIILFSGIKITTWVINANHTHKQIEEIDEFLEYEEIPFEHEDENTEIVNSPEKNNVTVPKEDPYYDYIKLPLISVDFTKLKQKNSDTVAFIKVNGTNINYPVVQTTNNDYYLNHSFDKSKNMSGWVFLDYRNDINNLNDNSIIYAHSMLNKTMFGSLKNILENNWYKNTNNHVINISTEKYNTLWQVFSVYEVPTETYYLTSSFGTIESHQRFLDTITSRSKFNFNTSVNTNDKILTLSTCRDNDKKLVLHAKLIKQQAR